MTDLDGKVPAGSDPTDRTGGLELDRLLATWALDSQEASAVFGVSARDVATWLTSGVPGPFRRAVGEFAQLTATIARYVKDDRIAEVVRRPADELSGQSILEHAQTGDLADVLDSVRRIFDLRPVQP